MRIIRSTYPGFLGLFPCENSKGHNNAKKAGNGNEKKAEDDAPVCRAFYRQCVFDSHELGETGFDAGLSCRWRIGDAPRLHRGLGGLQNIVVGEVVQRGGHVPVAPGLGAADKGPTICLRVDL